MTVKAGGFVRSDKLWHGIPPHTQTRSDHPCLAAMNMLPPLTRQVAKQQGEFVADLLQRNTFSPNIGTVQLKGSQKPFK